jgi:hypothetical protein
LLSVFGGMAAAGIAHNRSVLGSQFKAVDIEEGVERRRRCG